MTDPSLLTDLGNGYLQLGAIGAVLFILLVFVIFLFKSNNRVVNKFAEMNSTSINQLCSKIDGIIETNTETLRAMTSTFTKLTDDQNNNARFLMQILDGVQGNAAKLDALASKTDTMLNLKCKPNQVDD